MFQLMRLYQNVPMSLADACLVRMTEENPECLVLTNDRHFDLFRKDRNRPIPHARPDLP